MQIDLFEGLAKSCSFLMFARSFFIMSKYNKDPWTLISDHDIIYATGISFSVMNKEDANTLRAYGWTKHKNGTLSRRL